jgi:hypothetical protein
MALCFAIGEIGATKTSERKTAMWLVEHVGMNLDRDLALGWASRKAGSP